MSGKLYLVGTPIGNLSDFSPRGLKTLSEVDFIAAEDTRVSLKLLNHFGIKKPLVSYYEHNKYASGEAILARIYAGETCALVTDAGMPAISDPGEDLVRLCLENGISVETVPGPTALVSALALSGLSSARFCFEGFLSTGKRSRREHLESLRDETRTMVFYEAPHKLLTTLRDLQEALGDRDVSVSREITKLFEETLHTTLSGALAHFTQTPPKGEFVLVVAGAPKSEAPAVSEEQALETLLSYRQSGRSLREAARLAAAETGFSKNALYDMALKQDDK